MFGNARSWSQHGHESKVDISRFTPRKRVRGIVLKHPAHACASDVADVCFRLSVPSPPGRSVAGPRQRRWLSSARVRAAAVSCTASSNPCPKHVHASKSHPSPARVPGKYLESQTTKARPRYNSKNKPSTWPHPTHASKVKFYKRVRFVLVCPY